MKRLCILTVLAVFSSANALQANSYDRVVPLFEILGRLDIRPIKYLSVGPYYGIRNGTLAAGAAIRVHFVK